MYNLNSPSSVLSSDFKVFVAFFLAISEPFLGLFQVIHEFTVMPRAVLSVDCRADQEGFLALFWVISGPFLDLFRAISGLFQGHFRAIYKNFKTIFRKWPRNGQEMARHWPGNGLEKGSNLKWLKKTLQPQKYLNFA